MIAPDRPRRSALYLPASNAKAIAKARTLPCDVVILDLEDACPVPEKAASRAAVVAALQRPRDCLGYVRINALTTEYAYRDLQAVVVARVDGLVVPKIESVDGLVVQAASTVATFVAPT